MPVGEPPTLGEASISTRRRHPGEILKVVRTQHDAVGYVFQARCVFGAATCRDVQQSAGDIRVANVPRILVFKLMQTAPTATVT